MKKILFSLILVITTSLAFAQRQPANYDGRVKLTGLLEHFDRGGASLVTEANVLAKAQGAYGNIGYNFGYNYNKRMADVMIGYARIRKTANDATVTWSAGPALSLYTKPDAVKTKYLYAGVGGFVTLEKEESFEIEFSTKFNKYLKHDPTDANNTMLSLEADGIMKFTKVIGAGVHTSYNSMRYSQSKTNPPSLPYTKWVQNDQNVELGLFGNFNLKSFEINFGPELNTTIYKISQKDQKTVRNTGPIMLNFRLAAVYKFNYFKS